MRGFLGRGGFIGVSEAMVTRGLGPVSPAPGPSPKPLIRVFTPQPVEELGGGGNEWFPLTELLPKRRIELEVDEDALPRFRVTDDQQDATARITVVILNDDTASATGAAPRFRVAGDDADGEKDPKVVLVLTDAAVDDDGDEQEQQQGQPANDVVVPTVIPGVGAKIPIKQRPNKREKLLETARRRLETRRQLEALAAGRRKLEAAQKTAKEAQRQAVKAAVAVAQARKELQARTGLAAIQPTKPKLRPWVVVALSVGVGVVIGIVIAKATAKPKPKPRMTASKKRKRKTKPRR
jgi:hypothetical protein